LQLLTGGRYRHLRRGPGPGEVGKDTACRQAGLWRLVLHRARNFTRQAFSV
jgi:hypothetical protein